MHDVDKQQSNLGNKRGRSDAFDVLFTEHDLAARWQVSIKMLQNARLKGVGVRYVKLGRAVRYRLADIEIYEAENTRLSTSQRD